MSEPLKPIAELSPEEKRALLAQLLEKSAARSIVASALPQDAQLAPGESLVLQLVRKGPLTTRWYRFLALSDHWLARGTRKIYHGVNGFSLPAPRAVVKPLLWAFLAIRAVYHFLFRVFVCEPLFKAYCRQHGRRVRTGVYIPWVQGAGNIIVGDDVLIDGKCGVFFASRFSDAPTLEIGDGTIVGHNCAFTIGKKISIGRHCLIASDVWLFDSSGHPMDAEARLSGLPPHAEAVRPITVGDNVWIGKRSAILPGVSIGDGSIVAAWSVVMSSVPPHTLVAGNPAKKVVDLPRP
jgi:acetyltransferase-like isoleucine patch superfamily enzyme